MTQYKATIVQNNPHYLNKKLLLANASKNGLFRSEEDGSYIQIEINHEGDLLVTEITQTFQQIRRNLSLRQIGERYLHLKDPSVKAMLSYFILPEMEVERIFNTIRYNYLTAISLSALESPSQMMSARYNKTFQALAGVKIYQGNTRHRKDNDAFWQEAGFTPLALQQIDWKKTRDELQRILALMKQIYTHNLPQSYGELIAIKPGFHEIWTHADYFELIPQGDTTREKIFRLLRGKGSLSEVSIKKMPPEINANSYFSYAPCNVTEGPFVFRKGIAISYLEELPKIHSKHQLEQLKEPFFILDYYHDRILSQENLRVFLEKAERFKYFMC